MKLSAVGQLVLRGQRVVDLRVEAVGRLLADLRLLEVVLAERRAGDVRQRDERHQLARDRADAVLRDLVVGERHAVRAVDVAGQRIVDVLRHRAEVAVAHRHRRDGGADDVAQVVDRALVVAEEEQLVLDDRAAEREAAVGELGRRLEVREVVAGVGRVVVAEEEALPLKSLVPDFSVTLVIAPPDRPNSAS